MSVIPLSAARNGYPQMFSDRALASTWQSSGQGSLHRQRAGCIARVLLLASVIFAVISTAYAEPTPQVQCHLDPIVGALIAVPGSECSGMARTLGCLKDQSTDDLSVILDYSGDAGLLASTGAKVRTRLGSIYTADIPPDKLSAISSLGGLRYMRAAKLFHPMLDVSVPETGASLVRSGTPPNWTGYTGKGVITGFVDSGIDVNHQDFRNASGGSRVLYIWDQTTGTGGANHPSGYTYGTEWTKAQIDAGQCTQRDTAGHGSAVAGTAAGDGSATGNGWPAYRYVGMAPEADIIMVKTTYYDDKIVDGMNYIKAKANAAGKPFVINLSLGSEMGAHDGTDLLERTIDQISGQGAVVCTATGNSRSTDTAHYVHAEWTVPSRNSAVTANMNVPSNRANPFLLDIWYEGNDTMDYTVTTPNGYTVNMPTGFSTGGYYTTADGGIWLDNASGGKNAYDGDRECFIAIQNAIAGTWKITATGKTITQGGHSEAWIEASQNVYWATYGNNVRSCTIPGTSNSVITVGGYLTKSHWTNPDGTVRGWDSTYGEFYSAGGEGPTRDGRQKPDLSVPTTRIAAAKSANSTPSSTDIVEDGVHSVVTGTSMAVPHAVGAVALLLQKDPTATAAEIKSRLLSTARSDSQTGAVPNAMWGYGRILLSAAMALTPLYTTIISSAKAEPNGAPVKMPGQVVSAGYTQMGDRFYIENNDKSSGIQVRVGSGTLPDEKDVVTISGSVNVIDGERAITGAAVTRTGVGTGAVPKALGMVNRDLGGSSLGSTPGITGASALNNIGLLVRVWGRVTYIGTDHFRIWDGYLNPDGSQYEIKVRCPGLTKPTSTTQYAIVTGISSLELSGSTTIPLIRIRKQADLVYY